MTAAPYETPTRRIVVTALVSALFLVLGVLAQLEYGFGASLFLFALAAVGVVDLVQLSRRIARNRAKG